VAAAFRLNSARAWLVAAALAAAAASAALAQDAPSSDDSLDTAHSLRLPKNPQLFGSAIPSTAMSSPRPMSTSA
jgi:hypothetical protein